MGRGLTVLDGAGMTSEAWEEVPTADAEVRCPTTSTSGTALSTATGTGTTVVAGGSSTTADPVASTASTVSTTPALANCNAVCSPDCEHYSCEYNWQLSTLVFFSRASLDADARTTR